jgi:hypothetical protein
MFFLVKFYFCQIIRHLCPLDPVAAELMGGKRKIDDEISFLRVRLNLMTSIVACMRMATANREFDKMPGPEEGARHRNGSFRVLTNAGSRPGYHGVFGPLPPNV